jgi:hypothetical protein
MGRTTISLPDEIHERLRRDASRGCISMAELIRQRLRSPADRAPKPRKGADPMLKVAGICRGNLLSENLD